MYLSKSIYVSVWNCPKGAWINRYHPEAVTVSGDQQARFDTGHEVGDIAQGMFGPFVDVTAYREDGSLDKSQMIRNTQEEMARGTEVICEAAFSYEGLYCAVDLLRRDEEKDGWVIYEVKSSSHLKEYYTADVSYQKYVLEHCGVNVTGVFLVNIDSSYVLGPEGLDPLGFFRFNDLWEEASQAQQDTVPGMLETAERVLENGEEPSMDLAEACPGCDFFGYCYRNLPERNVFDLYRLAKKKMVEYYHQGLVSYEDLEEAGVIKNKTQLRQMDFWLRDKGIHAEKESLREFLSSLSYPLYFLDFETMGLTVPIYVGTKPFEQIPFQYSLHYIEAEGGELKHKEFLAESGPDPRRAVAEAICRDIPADACVTAFHKSTECGILQKLAEQFPDLADHLNAVAANVVDLLEPFQKGWYYRKEIGGSFSIKSILPAICPDDPELDYHELEGVHNGTEAMNIFPQIQYMDPEEQERTRKNLLAYCRLDTLAMVKVWEELKRAATREQMTC